MPTRLWRWAAFREVEDETPFATPKQAVEHEAYLQLLAARAGVRSPAVLTAAPTGDGHILLVLQHVAGGTLDRLDAATVDDRLLAAIWAEVAKLRAAGIAHRDLRRANVLVDPDRRSWLLDFGFAEAAASGRRLAGDVAEALASLACLVGAGRAVHSATETLGVEAVAQALPLLQPAALAAATRADLKARPGLLAQLREQAAAAAGTEPPPLEPLTRVRPRTLLLLVAAGFAVHLLLPQVGELRQTLGALQGARWTWLAVGLVLSAASYLAAAVAQLGAVDPPLALGRTTLVQVASSFANRLTPASLGGIGLNVRYLQRAGMDRPAAVARSRSTPRPAPSSTCSACWSPSSSSATPICTRATSPGAGRSWSRWRGCWRPAGWRCGRRWGAGGWCCRRCGRAGSWPGCCAVPVRPPSCSAARPASP
jgi:glycosyltransferase 2 family protein